MISIILVLVGLVGLFFIMKSKELKHKGTWILIFLIVLILYAGYISVIAGKNIDINSTEGVETVIKLYTGWLVHGFDNVKTLSGQAVKMDWKGNSSIAQKSLAEKANQKK